ncbi:hypothetical protein L195_g037764 [Trifolium pratense]|uniref:Uncharacterized protein n=1 Tax=Trifolium pratense TaxID=57577 RepID=A0A2K3LTA4_TRIPR|nr:hypothetical protein L195_g037764 [Trifolium pratense]
MVSLDEISIQARQAVGLEQVIGARIQQRIALFGRNNSVWNDSKEVRRSLGIKTQQLWAEWHSIQQLQQANPITDHTVAETAIGLELFGLMANIPYLKGSQQHY